MNFPLSAGLLEACVLAELNRQDVYGYQLTQQLRQVPPKGSMSDHLRSTVSGQKSEILSDYRPGSGAAGASQIGMEGL